jgi:hypothetical protein
MIENARSHPSDSLPRPSTMKATVAVAIASAATSATIRVSIRRPFGRCLANVVTDGAAFLSSDTIVMPQARAASKAAHWAHVEFPSPAKTKRLRWVRLLAHQSPRPPIRRPLPVATAVTRQSCRGPTPRHLACVTKYGLREGVSRMDAADAIAARGQRRAGDRVLCWPTSGRRAGSGGRV